MKFRDGPHVGRIYFSPVTLLFPPRRPDGRRSVPSSQKIPLSVKWAALQESFFFLSPSVSIRTDGQDRCPIAPSSGAFIGVRADVLVGRAVPGCESFGRLSRGREA